MEQRYQRDQGTSRPTDRRFCMVTTMLQPTTASIDMGPIYVSRKAVGHASVRRLDGEVFLHANELHNRISISLTKLTY